MKFIDINGKEHNFELRPHFKVKGKEQSRSKIQWKLGKLLCKIYGNNHVFEDYPLPGCNNVSWDFWLPHHKMAFEMHGKQHDEYIKHFHDSEVGFRKQLLSDNLKNSIAEQNDVTLIVVRSKDFEEWSVEELKKIITLALD